jgi:hypothetical protein
VTALRIIVNISSSAPELQERAGLTTAGTLMALGYEVEVRRPDQLTFCFQVNDHGDDPCDDRCREAARIGHEVYGSVMAQGGQLPVAERKSDDPEDITRSTYYAPTARLEREPS